MRIYEIALLIFADLSFIFIFMVYLATRNGAVWRKTNLFTLFTMIDGELSRRHVGGWPASLRSARKRNVLN